MKDSPYIERIIKYANKIKKYMKEAQTFSKFKDDEEKIDAVIFNLEQIGETAKKLSNESKQQYAAVDWPKIIGLRNMISHQYEGINLNIIFDIATTKIPELLSLLEV
jgi:uncharacterized protein with HEPN domain